MDEHKDKDVSGSTVFQSSIETVSDREASGVSDKTRNVEPVPSDVQVPGQVVTEGSFAEGVVKQKGGPCNGGDIMVGVMGSDVYVDDVCLRDDGGGNLSREATKSHGGSRELGTEGDVKILGGEDVDSVSKCNVDSDVEASNSGTESEVGKSSGVAESKKEGEWVDDVAKVREVNLGTEVGKSSYDAESKEEGELVEDVGKAREVNLGSEAGAGQSSRVEEELVGDVAKVMMANLQIESEVGKSSGVAEPKEEEELVEDVIKLGQVNMGSEIEIGKSYVVAESKEEVKLVDDMEKAKEVNLATESEVGKPTVVADSEKEGEFVEDVTRVSEVNLGSKTEVGKSSGVTELKEEGELEDVGRVREVNFGAESESSRVAESKEGVLVEGVARIQEVSDTDAGDMAANNTLQQVGIGNDQNLGINSAVEGSSLVDGSTGGEIKVIIHQVGVSENEAHNRGIENFEDSSAVLGSSVAEAQTIVDKSELVEEATDQDKETNDNEETALQDFETQKVGDLHEEVWNPGIEAASAPSATIKEGLSVETQLVEEEAMAMADNGNLNSKVERIVEGSHCSDSMEGVVCSFEKDAVTVKKDAITNANSKSLEGQTEVTVDGKVASMDNQEITCPNVERMDTDAFNENFCFSVEELQATVETANGSSGHHYDAFADLQSSQQPTQVVVGGEVAATDDKGLLNSEDNRKLITEECLDQSMPRDSAQVHPNVEPQMGVNEQVIGAEPAGLQKEQGKVKAANESAESCSTKCLDLTFHESAPSVVGGEVAETDDKVHSDRNFVGPVDVDLDGVLSSSSGNEQHIGTETDSREAVTHDTSTDDKVISTANVSDSAEKDHELKVKECIDNSVAVDPAQVDPSIGLLRAVQEQITHVEQLGREETEVVEQNLEAEAVCASRETEALVIDGEQTATTDNDATLNPDAGLEGPREGDQDLKVEKALHKNADYDAPEIESATERVVEEHGAFVKQVGLQEGQEIEAEEQYIDSEQPNNTQEVQASYQLPPDDEGEFSVSDLVWGKVRSHPWWPGQIFDPSDASEKAVKYHKKDCFLVAYFGDRTFAWNEASLLKPFMSYFSQVENQSNSEVFQNAVDCALEEVSRRVEFGLACSCIPKDTYDEIKLQIVENTGIRQEASVRDSVDKYLCADLFEPGKLVEYMKALAQCAAGGADRLELVIARSQLLAFYRLKGYYQLPEFQFCGGLLENADTLEFTDEVFEYASPVYRDDGLIPYGQEILHAQKSAYHKRKHNLKDTVYPRKKEKSLSELMGDPWDSVDDEIDPGGKAYSKVISPSSGRKRKGSDSFPDDSATTEGRKTISLAKVSTTAHPVPKPSFKIGECIRRVASQMTGSPSILKSNNMKQDGTSDGLVGDGSDVMFQHSEDAEMRRTIGSPEYSSLDELLSQLHLAARDPLKGYSFLTIIISFFSDFRNSVTMEQHEKVGGKRRQSSHLIGGSPETFEFEDMSDTYWTDRVIQNGSEEQPARKSRKRDNQLGSMDQDKALNKSNSRKQFSDGNHGLSSEKPVGYVDENTPAELVMHFPVVDNVPSEISLNKMFRRFGPLKESETEIDKDTNRARVVFKKCSDAEAAYGSAPKFNIFGSVLVNYQLNYTISVPFKSQPLSTFQGEEDATLFLQY